MSFFPGTWLIMVALPNITWPIQTRPFLNHFPGRPQIQKYVTRSNVIRRNVIRWKSMLYDSKVQKMDKKLNFELNWLIPSIAAAAVGGIGSPVLDKLIKVCPPNT